MTHAMFHENLPFPLKLEHFPSLNTHTHKHTTHTHARTESYLWCLPAVRHQKLICLWMSGRWTGSTDTARRNNRRQIDLMGSITVLGKPAYSIKTRGVKTKTMIMFVLKAYHTFILIWGCLKNKPLLPFAHDEHLNFAESPLIVRRPYCHHVSLVELTVGLLRVSWFYSEIPPGLKKGLRSNLS